MPLQAQKLNSLREEFDFPYAGDLIHITYNPQGYTPELEQKIKQASEGEYKSEGLVFMLKTMLVDWDLEEWVPKLDADGEEIEGEYEEDEDGNPKVRQFGVEDDKLKKLPVKFLADVTVGIAQEISGNTSEEGKPSAATSPPEATTA